MPPTTAAANFDRYGFQTRYSFFSGAPFASVYEVEGDKSQGEDNTPSASSVEDVMKRREVERICRCRSYFCLHSLLTVNGHSRDKIEGGQ